MPVFIQCQEPDAAVPAAVADGIRLLLLVGDTVDEAKFSRSPEYLLGLLAGYLASHAVFHDIVSELIEVQADLGGVPAIG